MPDEEYGLGRKSKHPEVPRATALYPATNHPYYRQLVQLPTYKYWYQGGAWLDQGNTGTCVAHALQHRRADSPVPTAGITEQNTRELYVAATGDTTLQEGTWALIVAQYLLSQGKIKGFYWCDNADQLRTAILTAGSVAVGTIWYNSMFRPESKYSNKYLKVDPSSGIAGGHEYLVNGINLAPSSGPPFYRIKNSWGTEWGKGGTARVACGALEELIFAKDGDAVVLLEA